MERFSKHQLCELVSCLSKNHVSAAEQLLNIRNSLRKMELEKAKEARKGRRKVTYTLQETFSRRV